MSVSLLHLQIKLSQVRTTVLPNNLDSVMRLGGIKAIYHLVTPAFRVRVTALAAVDAVQLACVLIALRLMHAGSKNLLRSRSRWGGVSAH